jgi:23S rRNA (adenine-N6)-dimethyltransferase
VGARRRARRAGGPRPSGQHFLRSDRIAQELVDQARILEHQTVLEMGAGTGRITRALARRAGAVVAVELDPDLVDRLRWSFSGISNVHVVEGSFLEAPLPDEAFRAFGNVPFSLGAVVLRRLLDDPRSPLVRADVILQYEASRKRASVWPSTLSSLGWLPWWEFNVTRRLPRWCFEPPPSVDAGMLSVTRREPSLLPVGERADFVWLLRAGFARGSRPLRRSLAGLVSNRSWKRLARERGISPEAAARDLDVFDWVDVFRLWRVQADQQGSTDRVDHPSVSTRRPRIALPWPHT